MQNKNEQELKPHMIAFVDFMGTSETVKKEERKNQLFELLLWVHNEMRAEGYYKAEKKEEGSGSAETKPTVTSFSDNIVITVPISDDFMFGLTWDSALEIIGHLIQKLFIKALENNFLIRGAIDVGELYHAKHMIFGNALINAYEHEQKAFYPRIILTDRCLDERKNYLDSFTKASKYHSPLKILHWNSLESPILDLFAQPNVLYDFDGTVCLRLVKNSEFYQDINPELVINFDDSITKIQEAISNSDNSYLRKNWVWLENYLKLEKLYFERKQEELKTIGLKTIVR